MKGFTDDHEPPKPTLAEQLAGTMFAPPPFSEPTTSREAAASVKPVAPTLRAAVLALLVEHKGLTQDEISALMDLESHTVCPRLWELEKAGLAYKSLERRLTRSGRSARVYYASDG